MPALSKSEEVDLLLRVLECSTQSEGWTRILDFIDAKLNCKSFLSEFERNGTPTKEFAGSQSENRLSDLLQPPPFSRGPDALQFLISEAPLLYPYCKTTLEKGEFNGNRPVAGSDPANADLAAGAPNSEASLPADYSLSETPGLISPLNRTETTTILFGCLFTEHTLDSIDVTLANDTFRRISKALAPGLDAYYQIEKERSANRIQSILLSSIACPAVLLSADRTVLGHTTSGIEDLLRSGTAVLRGDKLDFKNKQLEESLQDLLEATRFGKDASANEHGASISPPSATHSVYVEDQESFLKRITVDAIPPPESSAMSASLPWIVLRISRPLELPEDIETVLQQRYELSHSEAHLARHLTMTGSMNDTVDQLGITRNTAKTHLRRVFEKTGVHTQLQLAKLVHRLSGLF